MRYALWLLIALGGGVGLAQDSTAFGLRIEKIDEGVFAFLPTDHALNTWRAVSNSGAVVMDDGVLIYDSHWTPNNVREAQKLLRQHTDKPIRYVINSHFHADHTGGASAYGPDVELITHHATRDRLVTYFEALPEQLPGRLESAKQRVEAADSPMAKEQAENILRYSQDLASRVERGETALATLTFEKSVVIHRGVRAEVFFLGKGHTDGDALLFLPDKKIAFLGDLHWVGGLPNVSDGFTKAWIATLEAVLELGAERYVPGHGAVGDADSVREMIAYLRWLRSAVEPFVRENKGAEAAREAIKLPTNWADYKFPWHLPAGISKVYGEIEAGL